jgi:hypothetical protein
MPMQVFVLLSPKNYGPVYTHAGQTSVTQHNSYTATWEEMCSVLRYIAQTELNFGILPRRKYSLTYWAYGWVGRENKIINLTILLIGMFLVIQRGSQKLVLVLRKPNAYYSMNKISPFDPNLRQLNPLHILLFQFCKSHFNIITLRALELFKRPLPSEYLTENCKPL